MSFSSIISLLLSIVMGLSPAFTAMRGTPTETHIRNDDKPFNVFIGGFLSFGEKNGAYYMIPSYGVYGNALRMLEDEGYECYATTPGPLSSNWDRACHVYAELTGGTVDYGVAHSKAHGHPRFGRTYDKPLADDWGPDRPANLLGYSHGAHAVYMLAHLLAEGSREERAATPKGELSPLFAGGQRDLIHSVTSLAGTLNGTAVQGVTKDDRFNPYFLLIMMLALPIGSFGPFNGMYDIHLDIFGLSPIGASKLFNIPKPSDIWRFLNGRDNCFYDLSPQGAQEINMKTKTMKDVYYYSYVNDISEPCDDGVAYKVPFSQFFNNPITYILGSCVGAGRSKFFGETYDSPAGPLTIDDAWRQNDTICSVEMSKYPAGAPHKEYDEKKIERGKWQVMPTVEGYNHMFYCGMDLDYDHNDLFEFYLGHMKVLDKTY